MVIVLHKAHCSSIFLAVFLRCPPFVQPLHIEAFRLYAVPMEVRICLVLML